MSEREKTLPQKVAGLPCDLGRGFADRVSLASKLVTKGPVTPYMGGRRDVPKEAYVLADNKFAVVDVLGALILGYGSGFYNFADYRSKGVAPPAARQEVSPHGFEWNEGLSQYERVVWRGTLKPDRKK